MKRSWYEEEDTDGDFLTATGTDVPFANEGTSNAAVERQVAAMGEAGPKYSKAVDGKITVLWHGGSSVNAYSLPDWEQIGHWNIEFEEGLDFDAQTEVVKANIDRHIAEENYPS